MGEWERPAATSGRNEAAAPFAARGFDRTAFGDGTLTDAEQGDFSTGLPPLAHWQRE